MKFLLDMNLRRDLGVALEQVGHHCRHVGDIGMAMSSDHSIMFEARVNQEVIITHDLDYGHLLAFSGDSSPSVIIFRTRNTELLAMYSRILDSWSEISEPLKNGALITLEDHSTRIRRLPIKR